MLSNSIEGSSSMRCSRKNWSSALRVGMSWSKPMNLPPWRSARSISFFAASLCLGEQMATSWSSMSGMISTWRVFCGKATRPKSTALETTSS